MDKLIGRAAAEEARYAGTTGQATAAPAPQAPPAQYQYPHHAPKPDDSHYGYPYKRRSWLREILRLMEMLGPKAQ